MKRVLIGVIVLLILGSYAVNSVELTETTIYVDDDGGADYTNIQDAIDNATDGDTVYVYNGIYHENVRIGKSITLTGEDKLNTIIDARDVDNGIMVTVYNVQISGFKLTNSKVFNAGIHVFRADYTSISDCIITENNGIGIELDVTSYATISNCTITSNEQFGVVIYPYDGVRPHSNNNLVTGCLISDNEIGVFLDDTTGNSVIGNCISDNWEYGIRLAYAEGNKIKENDFIENNVNAYFQGPFRNYWYQNYWDRSFDMNVKIIVGSVFFLPWLNFDWEPSAEPNTIFGGI
jgi:parallel beta-helix repeat protein